MSTRGNSENCVEEPTAPEWLSKLESRREHLRRANKLGHESGAGAPCGECGDKCPGLDLHFWRKVCRNCKCRKDQHKCIDDDLSNWAQFEILGQICSKPAFIKINSLANQPLKLDWVPPNAAPDVVSDYMTTLGTSQVPIEGSVAAQKRKQQLEFQVPPHDLNATLCDNLTEAEVYQLNQYVQNIRENCVGQGSVVRIGNTDAHSIGYVGTIASGNGSKSGEDKINAKLAANKLVTAGVIPIEQLPFYERLLSVLWERASGIPQYHQMPMLSVPTENALHESSANSVCSLVQNGEIFDNLLTTLKDRNIDLRIPQIEKIAQFRKAYREIPQFRDDINSMLATISHQLSHPRDTVPTINSDCPAEEPFNSPVRVKNAVSDRFTAQMRHQDTPMRRIRNNQNAALNSEVGPLSAAAEFEQDPVISNIIHAEALQHALRRARAGLPVEPIVLSSSPMLEDFTNVPNLSNITKKTLAEIGVNCTAVQSVLANPEYYDALFDTLNNCKIQYADCKLLVPLKSFKDEILVNKPLKDELCKLWSGSDEIYGRNSLSGSNSSDSGFGSKASTPNTDTKQKGGAHETLPDAFQQLHLTGGDAASAFHSDIAPVVKCQDCKQPINFGDIAVKAERAGRDIAWHPQCFRCYTCREMLADLVYFFHGGKVYCGRDLAINLKIPRCKACDELIFTKEYTAAEGATFHIKHFCCYHCDTPLAGQQYVPDEKTNMPLCLKCYDEYFAAACQRCKSLIGPSDQGVSWGDIHWHGTCFICAGVNCGKSLIGSRFCVKQNMPFCSPQCVRSIT